MTTAPAIEIPSIELVYDDGEPMDSAWHRAQMELLIQSTHVHWKDRSDYYTGGNMFVYFSFEQARNRDFRGPDYFTTVGVDGTRERKAWVVWEEGGRYPDIIIELLSPTTRDGDLGPKKDVYERIFRTPEYFCYDPDAGELVGWRLISGRYEQMAASDGGRLESRILGASLAAWVGAFDRIQGTWLRLWDERGQLVPSPEELARSERQRAEAERQRADAEASRANALVAAARIVNLLHRGGVDAALAELERGEPDRIPAVLAAIEAIDPAVADALRAARRRS
jgi:Uma2 family endonuclease